MDYIQEWLFLGPFCAKVSQKMAARTDLRLQNGRPKTGQKTIGKAWQRYSSPYTFINLYDSGIASPFPENCFAHAFTYLLASERCRAKLLIGSDNSYAVWLNGKGAQTFEGQRGLILDSDEVPITLERGENRLLLRLSQFTGNWRFSVQLVTPQGVTVIPALEVPSGKLSVLHEPTVGYFSHSGEVEFQIPLYNAGSIRAKNVVLHRGNHTQPLGEIKPGDLRLISFQVAVEDLGEFLPGEGLWFSTDSSPKHLSLKGWFGPLFVDIMTGGFLPLERGAKMPSVRVPKAMQNQAVLICLEPPVSPYFDPISPHYPSLRLPQAGEIVSSDLEPPPGYKAIARVIYGGPAAEKIASKLGLYSESIDPSELAIEEFARNGLISITTGDFTGALEMAEKILKAIEAKVPASRDIVHLVGHAHIDMNWLWRLPETVQCCQDTFRQVIAFMEEFPEFKFSQSQTSTYHLIEEFDPVLFEKIKMAVSSERWEILGGAIDEGDTNLSSGEGIARSLLLGQLYYQEKFGKVARIGWLPDNFGHTASLPQLLRLADLEYYYFCRCSPFQGLFWWEAPGGARVLVYSRNSYGQIVDSSVRREADKANPKYRRTMGVYGVGDHGGGPTRQDIQQALLYREGKNYPRMIFSTAEEFFAAAISDGTDYPVHRGEMQYVFEGCYTTISEIKRLHRACENTLFGAELFGCLGPQSDPIEVREKLKAAWQIVTFHQFHDILCGSAIHESNRDSIAKYTQALATAENVRSTFLRHLADSVATAGAGQPIVVFNPLPRERTDIVQAEIFSSVPPPHIKLPSWGDFDVRGVTATDASVKLADQQGKAIPCQVVGGKLFPNGYRMRLQFRAVNVPAGGYCSYYASVLEPGYKGEGVRIKETTHSISMETELLSLTVDSHTGRITKLYDKKIKRNILKRTGGNALRIYMEKPHSMSAWDLGPISEVKELDRPKRVAIIERGPVRGGIEVEYQFHRSKVIQRIYLYAGIRRVECELEAHWFEQGDSATDAPMLRVEFPVALDKGHFFCDTPYYVAERPRNGREVPAQKWVDLANGQWGLALLSDSKYGYSCDRNVLRMTILRSSYDPDRYPDQGVHHFRYALFPHEGDWHSGVMEEGLGFNAPLVGMETASRKKGAPSRGFFLSLQPANVCMSAVKPVEKGNGIIVRFWEIEGKATTARLYFARAIRSAIRVNLLEEPLPAVENPQIEGEAVTVKLQPYEIVSLHLEF